MNSNRKSLKKIVVVLMVVAIFSITICAISAIAYIHKASNNNDIQKLLDLGQSYLEDGKYEQAVASLEAILEIDPKEAVACASSILL